MKKNYEEYFFNESDEESGYCSEGETEYGFSQERKQFLNEGSYAVGHKFFPKNSNKKPIVVLRPQVFDPSEIQTVMEEALRKEAFFKTIYPKSKTHLFKKEMESYRLVLPFIEGIRYQAFADYQFTKQGQIKILISAINAIIDSHNKSIVILDLNSGNMLYDVATGKTSLIDGGLSTRNQETIRIADCQCKTEFNVGFKQQMNPQNPPECYSIEPVKADPSMDIYSLGYCIKEMFTLRGGQIDDQVKDLLEPCLEIKPDNRPNLIQLRTDLKEILGSETDLKLNSNDIVKTDKKNIDFPYFNTTLPSRELPHPINAAAWAGFATGLITGIIVTGLLAGSVISFGISLAIIIPLVLALSPTIGTLSGFLTGFFLELGSNMLIEKDIAEHMVIR